MNSYKKNDESKCSLVPSRGGPPVQQVRKWAKTLGIPLGRKATMCAAIAKRLKEIASEEKAEEEEKETRERQQMSERTAIEQCKEVPSRGGPTADDVRKWARSLGVATRGKTKRQLCNLISAHLKTLNNQRQGSISSDNKLFVKQSEAITNETARTESTNDQAQKTENQNLIMKRQRADIYEAVDDDGQLMRVARRVSAAEDEESAVNCKNMRKAKCGSVSECEWTVGKGCMARVTSGDDTMNDQRALKRLKTVVEEVSGDPFFGNRTENLSQEDRDAFAALGSVLQDANDDKTPLAPPESDSALDITTAMYVLQWYMSCTPIATVVDRANKARQNLNKDSEEPGIAALVNYFVEHGFVSVTIVDEQSDDCPLPHFTVVSEIFDTSVDGKTCPTQFEGPSRSLNESSNLDTVSDIFKSRCCISKQLSYGSETEQNRLQAYIARKKRMLDEFARDRKPLTRKTSFYRWRREDNNIEPTKPVELDKAEPRCLQNTCAAPYTFGFGALRCTGTDGETHDCSGKQPPRLNSSEQLISAEVYQDVLQSVIEANDAVNARYRAWRYGYGSLQQNVDFVLAMRSFEETLQTLTHSLTSAEFMKQSGRAGLLSLTIAQVERYIALFLELRIAGFRVEHTADSIVNAPGVMTRTQEWLWSKIGKSYWRYLLGVPAVIAAYWWGGWLSAAFLAYELFQRFKVFTIVTGIASYTGAGSMAYRDFASQVTDKLSGYFLVKPLVDFGTWLRQTLTAPLFSSEGRVMGICETVATYLQNLFSAIVVWPAKKLLGTVFTSMQVPSSYSMKQTDWFEEATELYRLLNPTESVSSAREWVLENAGRDSFVEDMTRWVTNETCTVFTCTDAYTKLVNKISIIQDAAKLHNVARENYGRLINFPAGKFWLGVAIALLNSRVVDLRLTEDQDVKTLVDELGVDTLQVPDLFEDGGIGIRGTTFEFRPAKSQSGTRNRSGQKSTRLQRRRNQQSRAAFYTNQQTHQQKLNALGFFGK